MRTRGGIGLAVDWPSDWPLSTRFVHAALPRATEREYSVAFAEAEVYEPFMTGDLAFVRAMPFLGCWT